MVGEPNMRMTVRQLRRLIREVLDYAGPNLEVYDADWEQVPNELAAIEWAKDKLETEFYGRPRNIRIEGTPSGFAYLDRYAAEISPAGPTLVYCQTKEECEERYHNALADI